MLASASDLHSVCPHPVPTPMHVPACTQRHANTQCLYVAAFR